MRAVEPLHAALAVRGAPRVLRGPADCRTTSCWAESPACSRPPLPPAASASLARGVASRAQVTCTTRRAPCTAQLRRGRVADWRLSQVGCDATLLGRAVALAVHVRLTCRIPSRAPHRAALAARHGRRAAPSACPMPASPPACPQPTAWRGCAHPARSAARVRGERRLRPASGRCTVGRNPRAARSFEVLRDLPTRPHLSAANRPIVAAQHE